MDFLAEVRLGANDTPSWLVGEAQAEIITHTRPPL
jgi:hypothetical protein